MEAKELLKILYNLCLADDVIDETEKNYLIGVAKSMDAEHLTLEAIKNTEVHVAPDYPSEERDRMTILYYLLFLMKIDNHIAPEEKVLIHHYGFKLGFSELLIAEMISVIENHKDSKVPPNELIDIIIKHNN